MERLGDTISDRQLLLLFLASLPEAFRVETTRLEASLDLDGSMVERLIRGRHGKLSKKGETGLVARRHGVKRNQGRRARTESGARDQDERRVRSESAATTQEGVEGINKRQDEKATSREEESRPRRSVRGDAG